MAATAATITVYEQDTGATQIANSPHVYKEIIVFVEETADDTDTVAVDVSPYGISTIKYVKGYDHTHSATTEGAIITEVAPTTAVSGPVI